MKVAFDISALALWHGSEAGRRGIYRVVENLLHALHSHGNLQCTSIENSFLGAEYLRLEKLELPLISGSLHQSISRFSTLAGRYHKRNNADYVNNLRLTRKISRRSSAEVSACLARWTRSLSGLNLDGVDVFHQPGLFPLPSTTGRSGTPQPVRFLTIYDFIPFSADYPIKEDARRLKAILGTLREDDFAICISEHVKNEACERLNLAPEQIFVAPLAASKALFFKTVDQQLISETRTKFNLGERPYFLSLSALDPRKNMGLLIDAFAKLCMEQPQMDANLLLVGSAPEAVTEQLLSLSKKLGVEGRIILSGFVPDTYLAPLYSGALAFVFPSLEEGFGLPPLEAMQCGVPVICSNRTSLPEVVGDAGILFDPSDKDALCAAMWHLYNDTSLAEIYSRRGLERAATFSWDRCAADHLSAYQLASGN